jgi:predicted nucleic acid-binding protein
MKYLLDTNAVINFLGASMPDHSMKVMNNIVDRDSIISIITKMETLGFNFKSKDEQFTMEYFVEGSTVLQINNDIVNKTIDIRKTKKLKLPDAIIAATALVYDLTLITRNTSDFEDIQGLKVINPFLL